jgi:hypothetical protein
MSGSVKHAAKVEHRQSIRDAAERLLRYRRDPHVEAGDILLACVGAQGALELLAEIEVVVVQLRAEIAELCAPMDIARIPVPGVPSSTIEGLTDEELIDVYENVEDDEIPHSWVRALIAEIIARRAKERCTLVTSVRDALDEQPGAAGTRKP